MQLSPLRLSLLILPILYIKNIFSISTLLTLLKSKPNTTVINCYKTNCNRFNRKATLLMISCQMTMILLMNLTSTLKSQWKSMLNSRKKALSKTTKWPKTNSFKQSKEKLNRAKKKEPNLKELIKNQLFSKKLFNKMKSYNNKGKKMQLKKLERKKKQRKILKTFDIVY